MSEQSSVELAGRSLADQVTFICCIESGPLEPMTRLLVESLRQWGGRFARCPVLAVTPRFGPPLGRDTRQALADLGAEHVKLNQRNDYSWFHFLNKPYALAAAERLAQTPCLVWIDSDILVIQEPADLMLGDQEDFAACAPDKNIGSTGPDDRFDRYWQQVADLFGLTLDSFPWIHTEEENARIRLYWNSGIFVWRRSTGYAQQFLEDCKRLLESRIASHEAGIFFTDQVALGITMLKMKLRWRALSFPYNYAIGSRILDRYRPERFEATRLLHYHDALWPETWDETMRRIKEKRPDVHAWLAERGPLRNPAGWSRRAFGKLLHLLRERKVQAFDATCKRF